jgi:hypothetical protein
MQVASHLQQRQPEEKIFKPYPKPDFSHLTDSTLTILDITADGKFQDLTSPELFAKELVEVMHLPDTTKVINLIISDVNYEAGLDNFCDKLTLHLKELGRDVVVKDPSDPHYEVSFIEPPLDNNTQWAVYGIKLSTAENLGLRFRIPLTETAKLTRRQAEEKALSNFRLLQQCPDKKVLWKGSDINDWLNLDERKIKENPRLYLGGKSMLLDGNLR